MKINFPPTRALEFITGHVIYNPAYTYKFQLKTTNDWEKLKYQNESFEQLMAPSDLQTPLPLPEFFLKMARGLHSSIH